MTWKPPPVFGDESTPHGNNNHECCLAGDCSPVIKTDAWNKPNNNIPVIDIGVGAGIPSRTNSSRSLARRDSQNSSRSLGRRDSQNSIAWRPPPSFAIIQEEEEEERDNENNNAVDETTNYSTVMTETNEKNSSTEGLSDADLLISRQDANGIVGIIERLESCTDDGTEEARRRIGVEDFRLFRKEVARFVATKGKTPDDEDGARWNNQSVTATNNCRYDVNVGDEESLSEELIAAMDDESSGYFREFCRVYEARSMAIREGELFAFWEGVRLTACASRRLAVVMPRRCCREQLEHAIGRPQPKRIPSIRAMSIAHARKQCEAVMYSNDLDVSLLKDEVPKSLRPPVENSSEHRPRSHSLRAMSIVRIRREQSAFISDATDGSGKANAESNIGGNRGDAKDIKKLLEELEEAEKYQRRLEQQLRKAGVVIADDIPYDLAKQKVAEISQRMSELHGGSPNVGNQVDIEAEYFKLEQEMEKYATALELTEEWIEEQAEQERKWEDTMSEENKIALKMVLRHMPIDVRNRSELQLREYSTPNGKFLPRSIAQKFKRTNCLQLLRTNPEEMIKWHPSMFENLRVTGLTLTERRALHQHLKIIGDRWKDQCTGSGDKMTVRKLVWFDTLKSNFRESLCAYERHIDMYGPPESHSCPMIGRQCLLKADKVVDYTGDYGYVEDSEYFKPAEEDPPLLIDMGVAKSKKGKGEIINQGEQSSLFASVNIHRVENREGLIDDEIKCRDRHTRKEGLIDEIQGRGRERGGVLNEIQDRSRAGRGRGRGGLLGEIHGRARGKGRGSGRCSGRYSGRGGLLNEIQGRALNVKLAK